MLLQELGVDAGHEGRLGEGLGESEGIRAIIGRGLCICVVIRLGLGFWMRFVLAG